MARLELEVGEHRLVVDDKNILFDTIELLVEKLGEVNLKHSVFGRYPIADNESVEEWSERIKTVIEEMNEKLQVEKKQEGESLSAFLKRVQDPEISGIANEKYFDALKAIADVFGQGHKVTPESFKKTSAPLAQDFILNVLKKCKLSTSAYE